MELSIIIVNWNSTHDLRKCVASILGSPQKLSTQLIVIDSGSHDGCDRMLCESYPDVTFIQSASNIGFAAANNLACERATGETLVFLNPDTEVMGPALTTLHQRLHSLPRAGIVGPTLVNSDGTVQSSCVQAFPTILNQCLNSEWLRRRWPRSRLWGMPPATEEEDGAREVEAVSGACLMVKRAAFQAVGRFAEEFFMYAEDVDLAYRIRQAGYGTYYVPEARVVHHGGNSSIQAENSFAAVMQTEATSRFLRKTRGQAYATTYRISMLLTALGRLFLLSAASVPRGRRHRMAQLAKWRAVLRWALSRDPIVQRYYGPKDAAAAYGLRT